MRQIKIISRPIKGKQYPIVTETHIEVTPAQMRKVNRQELMFNEDYTALVPYAESKSEKIAKYQAEIDEIKAWFVSYDNQVAQYMRCQRMGEEYDAKYGTIEELDAEAKLNAAAINKIEQEIRKLKK